MEPILKLQELGFTFTLEGDQICYVCQSTDCPEASKVFHLLEEIRARKEEALRFLHERLATFDNCYQLICEAMDCIAKTYVPGTIDRIKLEAPELWTQIQETEREIDHSCQAGRITELHGSLDRLMALWNEANTKSTKRWALENSTLQV